MIKYEVDKDDDDVIDDDEVMMSLNIRNFNFAAFHCNTYATKCISKILLQLRLW